MEEQDRQHDKYASEQDDVGNISEHKQQPKRNRKHNRNKNTSNKKNVVVVSVLSAIALLFITLIGVFTFQEVERTQKLSEITLTLKDNRLSLEEVREQQKLLDDLKKEKESNIINTVVGGLGFIPSNNTERINVLLMGLDTREDDLTGRADTLMVFSLNQATGQVDMVSIPRDIYTEIVGKGFKDKINHSYSFGGEEMTIDTVENLLDIEIDHHVVFNFQGFKGVIDALGGIEVDVPFPFSEQNAKGEKNALHFEKGLQTLDGEEALAFARMRKQDPKGDVGRGERQQQVIQATLSELKKSQSIGTYIDLFTTVSGSMTTDVGLGDIPNLVPKIQNVKSFNTLSLQGEGTYIRGIYYMIPNEAHLEEVKALLQIEEVPETTEVPETKVSMQ